MLQYCEFVIPFLRRSLNDSTKKLELTIVRHKSENEISPE